MTCDSCSNWIVRRRRLYGDGTEVVDYESPQGKGYCTSLGIETPPTFHCSSYGEGSDHVATEFIVGEPWKLWKYGQCPDCTGRGSFPEAGMCQRCWGTGKVRFYDDGYVGEERTRTHPKEKEARQCTTSQVSDPTINVPKPGETLAPMPPPDPFVGQDTL